MEMNGIQDVYVGIIIYDMILKHIKVMIYMINN
jgi:hypothetical protein